MCPPFAGLPVSAYYGLAPAEVHRVEDIYIVVICRPVTAAENYQFLADGGAGHGPQGHGDVAAYDGGGKVECVCVEDVEFVETAAGIATTEYIDVGAN